jgi:hypothetical protein
MGEAWHDLSISGLCRQVWTCCYCRLCLHSSTFRKKFCLLGLMVVFGLGFKSSLN